MHNVFVTMTSSMHDCHFISDNNSSMAAECHVVTIAPPAAFSVFQLTFLGSLAALTSILTVTGNTVVVLSFVIERSIRQPTNYFIASLAVSDMLIGTISMPLYSVYLLSGQRWPLGEVLCDLWLSVDYTACLCSIYTVFCITVDRYCSVRMTARYRKWRTEGKVRAMVATTWVVPAAVFFTSIIGWQYFVGYRSVPSDKCYVQYMENSVFNFLLQVGYFWATMAVMCALYVGIYRVALRLHRNSRIRRKQGRQLLDQQRQRQQLSPASQHWCQTQLAQNCAPGRNGHGLPRPLFANKRTLADEDPVLRTISNASFVRNRPPPADKHHRLSRSPRDVIKYVTKNEDTASRHGEAGAVNLAQLVDRLRMRLTEIHSSARNSLSKNTEASTLQASSATSGDGDDSYELDDLPSQSHRRLIVAEQDTDPAAVCNCSKTVIGNCSCGEGDARLASCDAKLASSNDSGERCGRRHRQRVRVTSVYDNDVTQENKFDVIGGTSGEEDSPVVVVVAECRTSMRSRTKQLVNDDEQTLLIVSGMTAARRVSESAVSDVDRPLSRSNSSPVKAANVNGSRHKRNREETEFRRKEMIVAEVTQSADRSTSPAGAVTWCPANDHSADNSFRVDEVTQNHHRMISSVGSEQPGISSSSMVAGHSENDVTTMSGDRTSRRSDPSTSPSNAAVQSSDEVKVNRTKSQTRFAGQRLWSSRRRQRDGRKDDHLSSPRQALLRSASKHENRARKSLRTISIILGAFVFCWTPWHVLSLLYGFCSNESSTVATTPLTPTTVSSTDTASQPTIVITQQQPEMTSSFCGIPYVAYDVSYWLCYLNSPLNPFCYALANHQFRRTFARILRRDWHRT